MIPFKCCLCFQSFSKLPEDLKTVLSDFMLLFSKLRPGSKNRIELNDLALCRSCWVDLTKIHQLKNKLRFKNEICDADKSLLNSKIRRAQRLAVGRAKGPSRCQAFERQIHASQINDENDSDLTGQSLDVDPAEAISLSLNNIDESDVESCKAANVITTHRSEAEKDPPDEAEQPPANGEQRNQLLRRLLMAPLEDHPRHSPLVPRVISFNKTGDSDVESIELPEVTDVITSNTDSVSTATRSVEKETATADTTIDNTSESSNLESEPDNIDDDPTEVMSVDSSDSDSDSESEPERTHRVTSRSKRLRKNTRRSSGWRIFSSDVKQLSKSDFTYMNKYPFQRMEGGFKCGLCPAVSNICNDSSRIWYNVLRHIHDRHIGSNRVRATKFYQRFTEIAPNRFQYGKYKVELIDGNYRCEECGELRAVRNGGNKAVNMMEHIKRHHENPPRSYVCEFCGKVYRTSFGLSEHKKIKHTTNAIRFPCNDCGKTFVSRGKALTHHKNVHEGFKEKFICEVCGKECSQKHSLKEHIAFVHNGQMIKCDLCDKTFGSKVALGIHRHCHLGTKFVCDICGMDFSQQCSVTRHKRTAHPQ